MPQSPVATQAASKPRPPQPWSEVLREIQRAWAEAYQQDRPAPEVTPKAVSPRPAGC